MSTRLHIALGMAFLSVLLLATAGIREWADIFPSHFPEPSYDFSRNPLTADKVELGRALFYDPILSRDSSISCASCHSPYNAFSHTDHDLSHGIEDRIGTRNAPALFNLAWQDLLMWDGAINHLDMQALAPLSSATEMDESIEHVVEKLQACDRYPQLFARAFGDEEVTGQRVLKALSQFQLTLVSADAKYDSVQRGTAKFNAQQEAGHLLYRQHCQTCHPAPLFSTYAFADNGLPVDSSLNDAGRYQTSNRPEDRYRFKVPSLRNLSYTFPYMHDGRFKKLSQVLRHYTDGLADRPGLGPELRGGLSLNPNEKADLIAFLLTLNDRNFVFDPKHQFPKNIFFPGEGNEN